MYVPGASVATISETPPYPTTAPAGTLGTARAIECCSCDGLVMRITIRPAGADRVFGTNASSEADAEMLRIVVPDAGDVVVLGGAGAGTEFVAVVVASVVVGVVAPVVGDVEAGVVVVELVGVVWFVGVLALLVLLDPPQAANIGASATIATPHSAPRWRADIGRCIRSPLVASRTRRRPMAGRAPLTCRDDTPAIGGRGATP
jgi:hypothetical protein